MHDIVDPKKALAMVSLGDFSRLVSAIHAAAITPQHWIEAMDAARTTFGSLTAALVAADGTSRAITTAYLPLEAERSYGDYYRTVDYVLDAVEHSPIGLVRTGKELIAINARSEFNVDWMQPHRMNDGLFVRLTGGPQPTSFLVAASEGPTPFATPERVQLFTTLIPHLQQALHTQVHLANLRHQTDDVAEAVDNVRNGMFVVGTAAAVIYLNRVAEDMVTLGDGPDVRSGCLGVRNPSVEVALHREIASAIGDESAPRCGSSLLCPRIGGKRPYVVHVLPFRSITPEPRALVIVIDPERHAEPPRDLLRRLYGLTNAEIEIAESVVGGQGLKAISDEMSLSLATVKTHLQHVFGKTQTHRQAELVRLLMSIAP